MIVLVVIILLGPFALWLNLDFGIWQLLVIIIGVYAIYLNFKALRIER